MSELPRGWADATLGELFILNYGKSLPAGSRRGGPVNVYGSNGIVGNHVEAITSAPVIILGRKGSIGEVHYSEKPCYPIDTTYYIDDFSGFDPNFVHSLFRSLPFYEMNRATAVPGLNRDDVYGLSVRVPPVSEQKRIVAKIHSLTARTARACSSLDRIPALVAKYKSAILDLAFSGKLTPDFRDGAKGATHGLADNWSVRLLSEISEIQGGIQVGKKRVGNIDLVKVPYLRVANVQRGWLNLNEIKVIAVTPEERDRLLLRKGDVLMNEGGDRDKLGRGWVWDGQISECIHQNHVFRIRLHAGVLPPEFVSYFANERGLQYFFDEGTQTTNLASISRRKVGALPVPVPPFDEALEIVRRIETSFSWLDRVTADHASASRLLPKLDAAILSKGANGELVRQDQNDEPASELLMRVKARRSEQSRHRRERTPRGETISEAVMTLAEKLELVLMEAGDWIPAQTAFQRCGIGDGSLTDDIERLYAHLRDMTIAGRLEAHPINDSQGRKIYDRIRLKVV